MNISTVFKLPANAGSSLETILLKTASVKWVNLDETSFLIRSPLSDHESLEITFMYTTWSIYLELGTLQANAVNYCTEAQ